jgi:hypothetical protein
MCDDWRRLHQARGVCGGSPENHRVTQLSHKAEAEDRAWLSGQNRLTGLENRSDRFGVAGRQMLRSRGHASGLSGIHPGYSCKEGRIVEDGLLVEFPCTPTRTPAL